MYASNPNEYMNTYFLYEKNNKILLPMITYHQILFI